ncbi:helix-turn-helix transcriptional regulator [Acidithiobacillus sp. MC6.1]|nr:helix-turn-helix transcriptional regulator [Acidithiobacillus sp. MC6.1]
MNNIYGEPGNIPRVAKVIMAVSHPIRYKMICLIGAGDISLMSLTKAVNSSRGNTSQHLILLKNAGLVVSKRIDNRVYCHIADPRILYILSTIKNIFSKNNIIK